MLAAAGIAGTAQSRGTDYVTCDFDEAAGVLEVTERFSEGALIRRSGERIAALQPNGDAGFEEVDCGATTPTITNTERIVYRLMSDGITEAGLSLARGPLAPGRTDEGPTSEIETIVRPSPQAESAELSIHGGAVNDHFRAGSVGLNAGVNLNTGPETTEPDIDVTLHRPDQVGLSLKTGEGADTVDLTGGPETTGPLSSRFVFLAPGPGKDVVRSTRSGVYAFGSDGADLLELGKRSDAAEGGKGGDTISTGPRRDLILPGPGRDAVAAGSGNDMILGSSGGVDVIDCGAGRDRAEAGHHDRLRNCESVERISERPVVHFEFG